MAAKRNKTQARRNTGNGGGTPGYPESHGCIHLPNKFAEKLYGLTKIGTAVIIEG